MVHNAIGIASRCADRYEESWWICDVVLSQFVLCCAAPMSKSYEWLCFKYMFSVGGPHCAQRWYNRQLNDAVVFWNEIINFLLELHNRSAKWLFTSLTRGVIKMMMLLHLNYITLRNIANGWHTREQWHQTELHKRDSDKWSLSHIAIAYTHILHWSPMLLLPSKCIVC